MTKFIRHGVRNDSVAGLAIKTLREAGHSLAAQDIAASIHKPVQNVCSALSRLSKSGYVTPSEGTWPRQYDLGPRAKP